MTLCTLIVATFTLICVILITAQDARAQNNDLRPVLEPLQLIQDPDSDTSVFPEIPEIPSGEEITPPTPGEEISESEGGSIPLLIENVSNSVVGIVSEVSAASPIGFGINPEFDGSGFVYDKEGKIVHIVTNEHVVSGYEEERFYIYFQDGSRYVAKVIGTDPFADIAVLQIIWNVSQPLQPLLIGNSSDLRLGQEVIAIGNPFLGGESYVNLITRGIISKLGIEAALGEPGAGSILDAVVSDAPGAGGFSGGPLLNNQGQLIGIIAGGDPGEQCCSYAIPSNSVSRIVPILIETGEYLHPYVGIIPVTLNADQLARELVPRNIQGVIVSTIDRDSPAHKAGIRGAVFNEFSEEELGDIILAIDGKPVSTADEFNAIIDTYPVGDDVDLTLFRNDMIEHVTVTLE